MAKENETNLRRLKDTPELCKGCWRSRIFNYSDCWFYWEGKKFCPSKEEVKGVDDKHE